MSSERKLVAIVSADIAGYSRLMAANEAATVDALEKLRPVIEDGVRNGEGRLVDFVGDNFLAEFATASEAISCAVGLQQQIERRAGASPEESKLRFRMGIHVGEVRAEGSRVFGTGVNIAARLEGLAEPGGLCISATVREQIGDSQDLIFRDLGLQEVKNIPSPVHAFQVTLGGREDDPATDSLRSSEVSIAVLPFVNMSADPEQGYFGDGMAEELINAIAHIEGIRVIARTSAFSFKGQQVDITTIGRKLNVATVLEGSVRKAGNRVRVSVQLVDVKGGHHLWSEIYDRPLDDVFEIQDEIARAVVLKIRPKLLGEEAPLIGPLTSNGEAYDLYLRAGERIAKINAADCRAAVRMLEMATGLDPNFTQAWARLALACIQMDTTWDNDPAWSEQAEAALDRAIAADPDDAEVHSVRGRFLWSPRRNFQHRAALTSFDRALRRRPGDYDARLWRGVVLFHVGLMDEGLSEIGAALELQPEAALALQMASQVSWAQGRYDRAKSFEARAFAAEPSNFYLHNFAPALTIYAGQIDEADEVLRTARRVVGKDAMLDSLEALLWAHRRDEQSARAALQRALGDTPSFSHTHHVWHFAAATLALLGEEVDAVALLQRAANAGFPNYPLFRDDPHFAELRDRPPMRSFLATLEREWGSYRREFGAVGDGERLN